MYSVSKNSDRIAIILTYFHYFRKMSKLIFALPNNGSGLDGYKTHTLTHPKGKPYTFLEKDNKIFEINHLKEKYHSSFITSGEKTTSKYKKRGLSKNAVNQKRGLSENAVRQKARFVEKRDLSKIAG